MAFVPVYCSGCGLEIYPDEELVPYKNKDVYHGKDYPCSKAFVPESEDPEERPSL